MHARNARDRIRATDILWFKPCGWYGGCMRLFDMQAIFFYIFFSCTETEESHTHNDLGTAFACCHLRLKYVYKCQDRGILSKWKILYCLLARNSKILPVLINLVHQYILLNCFFSSLQCKWSECTECAICRRHGRCFQLGGGHCPRHTQVKITNR